MSSFWNFNIDKLTGSGVSLSGGDTLMPTQAQAASLEHTEAGMSERSEERAKKRRRRRWIGRSGLTIVGG